MASSLSPTASARCCLFLLRIAQAAGWYVVFKRHVLNHVSAAVPRLRILQNIQLAVDHSDTGWPEHLVPGENIKVASIEAASSVRMCVKQPARHPEAIPSAPITVRHLDHLLRLSDGPKRIRNLRKRNEPCARPQELLIFVEHHLPAIIDRRHAQPRAFFRAEHLPWNDVGVMLEPSDDDLIVFLNVLLSPNSAPPD